MVQEFVEALVVLEPGVAEADEVLAQVGRHAVVLFRLPPRIVVVRLPSHNLPMPAVAGTRWYLGNVPEDVAAALTPAQRLFVDAWVSSRRGKTRPGEGLSWDTPGREAPDWPDTPGSSSVTPQ